ncbi:hypothetical protein EST38_g13269, partial [Candolleomyces aberdarensis]
MSSPEGGGRTTAMYNQEASRGGNYNGKISGGVNPSTYGSGKNVVSDSHNHSKMKITAPNITGNNFNTNINVNTTNIFHIIQTIFAFFHLAANRGALTHPFPGSDEVGSAGAAAAGPVHYNMDGTPIQENLDVEDGIGGEEGNDSQSSGSGGKLHDKTDEHDYDVSSLNDLDLRSIQAKSTTNAEIYTRLMLNCCDEGLPCWRPRPLSGTQGITPGDVGRFNLTNGFQKLFNVWDEEFAGSWQAPTRITQQLRDYFPEGHSIANGASSTIRLSPDRQYVALFEFPCTSEQGAVLACTTSADLEELDDPDSLRDFVIQHAGALYQQATSMKKLAEDSLYIVTGCIKSASWGLAAYRDAPADQVLRLEKRFDTSLLDTFASKKISVFRGVAHLLPADTDSFTDRIDDPNQEKAQGPNGKPHFHDDNGHGPLPKESISVMSSSSSEPSQDGAVGGFESSFFQRASKVKMDSMGRPFFHSPSISLSASFESDSDEEDNEMLREGFPGEPNVSLFPGAMNLKTDDMNLRSIQGKYHDRRPSNTVTKYEVNRERQIGVGGFSKVYRGTWNDRTVAIKVLKLKVTNKLFIREVEIWKKLHHPNILELYGASSATEPPWFFVSPYMKRGNLVEYLRKVEINLQQHQAKRGSPSPSRSGIKSAKDRNASFPMPGFRGKSDPPAREFTLPIPLKPTEDGGFEVRKEWDLFRFMLEIAQGMQYLHSKKVLHGDLKASNVLVDDGYHCVITDFGRSEIKSEAYRLSGESPPHQGTMCWQAPEIMTEEVEMTKETDVYAFSITCVEIVNLGKLPWGIMLEDEAIRQRVLKDNARPNLNPSPFNTPSLQEILKLCWHRDPARRPQFSKIVRDLELLQKNFGAGNETPKGTLPPLLEDSIPPSSPSPDMRPNPLPPMSPIDAP